MGNIVTNPNISLLYFGSTIFLLRIIEFSNSSSSDPTIVPTPGYDVIISANIEKLYGVLSK